MILHDIITANSVYEKVLKILDSLDASPRDADDIKSHSAKRRKDTNTVILSQLQFCEQLYLDDVRDRLRV